MAHSNGQQELPTRVKMLLSGVEITGAKNKNFGEPLFNLSLAGAVKRMLRQNQNRAMSAGEEEALEQVVTLICRAYSGEGFTEKTYVNGATYFAIAGEIAQYHDANEQAEEAAQQKGLEDEATRRREKALTEEVENRLQPKQPLSEPQDN